MPQQIDVEKAFADFVRGFGGEVVEDIVGASPDFRNADYLFRSNRVVAELKRVVEDKSEDDKASKKFSSGLING